MKTNNDQLDYNFSRNVDFQKKIENIKDEDIEDLGLRFGATASTAWPCRARFGRLRLSIVVWRAAERDCESAPAYSAGDRRRLSYCRGRPEAPGWWRNSGYAPKRIATIQACGSHRARGFIGDGPR